MCVRMSWLVCAIACMVPVRMSYGNMCDLTGRMEKEETDTDAESGNGHGKWKILAPSTRLCLGMPLRHLLDTRLWLGMPLWHLLGYWGPGNSR